MCFSPEASFAVAGALVPAGGYCAWAAWKKDRGLLPLAVTPLLLAVQQAAEGVVWLALDRGDAAAVRPAALVFLFFALAWWPFWLPLVAAARESRPARALWLTAVAGLASGWWWVLYYPLASEPGSVRTHVVHHSIRYDFVLPVDAVLPRAVVRVGYLLSMVVPLLAGPRVFGIWPGLVLAASAGVAAVAYSHAFASVWCFFAAVLSGWLAWFFWRLPAAFSPSPLEGEGRRAAGGVGGPASYGGDQHERREVDPGGVAPKSPLPGPPPQGGRG